MKLIKPKIKITTKAYTQIKTPKILTPQIAELIGIHFGDGCIHVRKRKSYIVTYTFNVKDNKLIEDTKSWFRELFGIELKSFVKNNGLHLYTCSKMLCYFLHENFGAPLGKKDFLSIPPIIKEKDIYLKAFLRGLHRTDGCVFIKKDKKYRYPIVKITTKCYDFSIQLQKALILFDFRATINKKVDQRGCVGYDVTLHGTKQYQKWISEISDKKKIKSGDTGIRISEQ
ncbi:hypothetical protein HON71_04715 [Candidatus Woesearchaeota archaeon]|jgi:hypothetical protein|nr:hypothetical protein [Candidatus Woesearchaeota archaeon]MBT5342553.1 hypothetical protein [Candidatus Woesearchaeota archaeon]